MSDSEIRKLWQLQSILSDLADRERQMASKPGPLAEMEREYQAVDAEMAKYQEQLETIGKDRRRVDGELSDQQELLKKYQGQLMQVKNQQQYAAAWKEIDATRKHVKELEDSVLKLMTDADDVQKKLDEKREGFAPLKARYDEAHEAWQGSMGDLKKEAEELRAKASAVETTVSPRMRDQFNRLLKQRQGVAMVGVAMDACSSCRTKIRPALQQQLRRGEFVQCEGCHRILYWEKAS
ncbi:MAG TPA: C4-type zinc ribbon domain-containing protein [Thermoanaerobaculia bacterium]